MALTVPIPPGARLRITVTFSAANENAVAITNQADGEVIKGFNNYFGGGGVWDSGLNRSSAPTLLLLSGSHKNTPPDGSEPWHPSPERILYTDALHMTTIIGYEDATDMDFNDARAVLQYSYV